MVCVEHHFVCGGFHCWRGFVSEADGVQYGKSDDGGRFAGVCAGYSRMCNSHEHACHAAGAHGAGAGRRHYGCFELYLDPHGVSALSVATCHCSGLGHVGYCNFEWACGGRAFCTVWSLALGFLELAAAAAAQILLVCRQLRPERMLLPSSAAASGIAARQIALLALSVLLIAAASVLSGVALQSLCVAAGLAVGVWTLHIERSATAKLLPRGGASLKHPLGMLYVVVALLLMGSMTEIFVPYFLQHLHGLQPLTAGYVTALLAGGWSLASILFSGKSGSTVRRFLVIGPGMGAVGLAVLALVMPMQAPWVLGACALALTCIGLGVGMAWPHVLNAIMHSADHSDADVAASAITTVQLYGMAVGAALVGLVVNAMGVGTQTESAALGSAALWLFGLFALFPAISVFYTRRFLKLTVI